jgi:hypothetical protein
MNLRMLDWGIVNWQLLTCNVNNACGSCWEVTFFTRGGIEVINKPYIFYQYFHIPYFGVLKNVLHLNALHFPKWLLLSFWHCPV